MLCIENVGVLIHPEDDDVYEVKSSEVAKCFLSYPLFKLPGNMLINPEFMEELDLIEKKRLI
jgi:hypothetical protein